MRIERYIKDMLIEMHTLREMVDTLVLPAAFDYSGKLAEAASQAKSAGIKSIPQVDAANKVGALIVELQKHRADARQGDRQGRGNARRPRRSRRSCSLATAPMRMAEVRKCCRCARARRCATTAGRCRSTGRCSFRCEK